MGWRVGHAATYGLDRLASLADKIKTLLREKPLYASPNVPDAPHRPSPRFS